MYDYIELYNSGTTAVDLTNYSVQYASAAGAFSSTGLNHTLSGSIGAGKYYLIQESVAAKGGTTGTKGVDLPVTANLQGGLNLSYQYGKVALVNGSLLTTANPTTGTFVDLIGYGSTANYNNGKPLTVNLTNTTAVFQANDGTLSVGAPSLHLQSDYNSATPTPIPAAAWLLGSGLLGLVGIRRKQS
jgi:hypothetical protein